MAIQLKSTKNAAHNGVKILGYGRAGVGKTTLIRTLPKPIIISAEGGMLSLAGSDIPYLEVSTIEELQEAYSYVSESNDFESVAIDSISEIAEVILNAEKKTAKDPRQAYGAMQEQITDIIRAFRDLPGKNVYISAKQERTQDDTGRLIYSPSMPGQKVGQALPYFFDEVFSVRADKDSEGNMVHYLQTSTDGIYEAKDRSGKLEFYEESDLGAIINKIKGVKK